MSLQIRFLIGAHPSVRPFDLELPRWAIRPSTQSMPKAFFALSPTSTRILKMIYIEVDDIGEHLTKAAELGGEVMIPETKIPGGGHFAWLKDVDGNMIGLIEN